MNGSRVYEYHPEVCSFALAGWRPMQHHDVFAGFAASPDVAVTLAYDGGDVRSGTAMAVSGEYFEVLGLRPTVGRLIGSHGEPALDESRVIVLGHDYWDPARLRVLARLLKAELPLMHR